MRSQVSPGEVRASLPPAAPEQGEPFSAVLADLDRVVLPGVTHWQHPGFFGYFPANTSGPSVLGDLVSAGLGVQGMSWVTSPAATELEQHVMDWLADLLGLPASFRSDGTGGGVVQDSSSGANLVALLAALHRSSTGATLRHGVEPDRATVYVSSETHSSMEKAVRIAGLGTDAVRIVEVDGDLAMRPAALAARLERDVARGYTPVLVCATVGTTSTTAVDPLAELGPICQKYGVWLHVDAAYAGVSAVVPELRALQAGVEWADSYTTDAHKWLLTGFDATLFWVADRAALTGALSILPGVPAQRRDRGRRRRRLPRLADPAGPPVPRAEAVVRPPLVRRRGAARPHPRPRRPGPGTGGLGGRRRAVRRRHAAPASLVCLRPRWADDVDADVATMTLLERLNDGGEVFLTHTTVGGTDGAAGGRRLPRHHPRARRAGLGAAARGPRLAGRRLRRGSRRARGRAGARAAAEAASAPGRAATPRRPSRRGRARPPRRCRRTRSTRPSQVRPDEADSVSPSVTG